MPSSGTVRLIAAKEFRDLLRDRRTVLIILVLPAVLYPLFGTISWAFANQIVGQTAVVAVAGAEHLPADPTFPRLLAPGGDRFDAGLSDGDPVANGGALSVMRTDADPAALLLARDADAVLVISPTFAPELVAGRAPAVTIRFREGDDKAKLAARRLGGVLHAWEARLRETRFEKHGLPKDFDRVLTIEDPQADKPRAKRTADELRDVFARVFPFLLMMWLIAGSIQPGVDMTAGEKERGTMETLLISPAERSEIVIGKFLATSAFAAASVVWNVLWLGTAAVLMERLMGHPIVNPVGMLGCLVLGLPQAMLFGAVCVALGVFAKSTKEGQYYLIPLILAAMPLAFWSMSPGMRLGPTNFWVPVTGAMLLQKQLLSVSGDPVPWEYFFPVLGALAVWIGLALAFAVWQFTREDVLFREGGPNPAATLRRLFRRPAQVPGDAAGDDEGRS